jgi:RNA polymerase sigma-70 factor (ECF subfamily)
VNHGHFEELCAAASIGQATAEELAQVEQHTSECDACRRAYFDYLNVASQAFAAPKRVPLLSGRDLEESLNSELFTRHFFDRAKREGIVWQAAERKLIEQQPNAALRAAVEPDDETLLLRMQASDTSALSLLFQRYSRLTLSIARRVLRDNEEAEDLVQDVFLFLFKSKMFDPEKGSARSWLMQVTYHRAYDRRRYLYVRSFYDRAKGSGAAAEALPHPVNPGIENPEEFYGWQSYLRPAFDELSEDQRKTLMLHFYEGYTMREISEKLGQSFGNVQHHYYRGLDHLRKYVFHKNGQSSGRCGNGNGA